MLHDSCDSDLPFSHQSNNRLRTHSVSMMLPKEQISCLSNNTSNLAKCRRPLIIFQLSEQSIFESLRNHDLVAQDNLQILLYTVPCRNYLPNFSISV